jgi:UDP-N-acetylmuramate dehydrogenase
VTVTSALARLRARIPTVRANEPLSRHTSFRIGGPAALYIECDSVEQLSSAVDILSAEDVAWTVLGKGSNVLVSDAGYDGAVIVLGSEFKRHTVDGEHMRAGAAVGLAALVQDAFGQGLSGFEFAVGIPGTLGGALAMNAGSRDEWIGAIVESVTLFVPGTGLTSLRGTEIPWAYRTSGLAARGIICEASLRVQPGERDKIRRVMEASLNRRKKSQPLGKPSAGSVFVNPPSDSAGRLIEAAGLKGLRIGGAQVSEVHANFIVNAGGASATDVVALVRLIRETIEDRYGVELKPEIRFLGSFDEA